MDFLLFLLVNFTLFLRPSEIIPALEVLPIYNYTILAAFAVALPKVIEHLRPDRLSREPITVCVLGLLPAVVLSHLAHFDTWNAREMGFEFFKVVLYYLLLISVVDSTPRLRTFLYAIALFTATSAAIAMLQYYEYIDLPALSVLEQRVVDPVTGDYFIIPRLRATGIFNDPNDLSMIAVVGISISAFALTDKRRGLVRMAWLIPLALLLTTVVLTMSRGGFLALGAAISVVSYLRFGLWKSVIPIALFVPIAVVLLADRGEAMEDGTGASRVELWSEGLLLFKQSPLFGIGAGNYAEEVRHVAHNSFVHSFVELGLFGGALFLGATWFGGLTLWKLDLSRQPIFERSIDSSFQQMRPYLLGMLAGYGMSMMSLSRSYVVPTYMVFGIVNVYSLEAQRHGIPGAVRLTPQRIFQLVPMSVGFLIAIYIFIRIAIR